MPNMKSLYGLKVMTKDKVFFATDTYTDRTKTRYMYRLIPFSGHKNYKLCYIVIPLTSSTNLI